MVSEADIEGHLNALVGALKAEDAARTKTDKDLHMHEAEEAAVFLIKTALVDLHRIADALEDIALHGPGRNARA